MALDYTFMDAPQWEPSIKKILWAVLILLVMTSSVIVALFAIKVPQYQAQVDQTAYEYRSSKN
ncbi:hypothetical protein KW782_01045 [Candidatus Parcubacteria bacterium]|nr:hypothetical protein [Candidatus Parcubacteria bacterium]